MGRPKTRIRLWAIEAAVADALAQEAAERWQRGPRHEVDDPADERMRRRLAVMAQLWRGIGERAELVTTHSGNYTAREVESWRWAGEQAQAALRTIARWHAEDGDEAEVA